MPENEQSEDVTVAVPAADAIAFTELANVTVRESLTAQHLWAALHFARLCDEREAEVTQAASGKVDFPHRSYAMASVKFAASFLESLVNELFSDAADQYMSTNTARMRVFTPQVITTLATLWDETEVRKKKQYLQLFEKYQQALGIAGVALFAKADPIYSSAQSMIYLRNQLVHFKVGWQKVGVPQNQASEIERRLKPEFLGNRQPIGMPWFPNKCLGAGCAQWACTTATVFADEWLARMALPQDYKQTLCDFGAP
ncbi:hypothetical protein NONI108955_00790 [Nocardia ninae]|uniref:Uncharacterized protein n=1 Tax=Nocardia ninae NBRC 108245 TaxID=1210091 RepID=A0A511MBS3_9NOCA|nr:hypothetical protein [Nocardia ninae]GEM38113.1 hypothetical protein NN4_26320 [Nocardia ninae NBRC 108245]